MRLKEISILNANGCILSSSIKLKKNGHDIKLGKGTIINKEIIRLFKENHLSEIHCFKINNDEIHENIASEKISKNLISNNHNNLTFKNYFTGRTNILAKNNGVFYYDEEQLIKLNSLSSSIAIGALKPFSTVEEGQSLSTIKIIPFAIKKKYIEQTKFFGRNCFKLAPFIKMKVGLIQTFSQNTKISVLDKTKLVMKDRLKKYGINKLKEYRVLHNNLDLNKQIAECLTTDLELILIFGTNAIKDINDIIPKTISDLGGKILRFGMPVEPGNLILIGTIIKENNKKIYIVGMPTCARSPKENGADWVLQRVISGLTISQKVINKMSIGGLIK